MADTIHFGNNAADRRAKTETQPRATMALADIPVAAWRALGLRAAEPNAYQLPDWIAAIAASARGGEGACALAAWQGASHDSKLIGLIPVLSLWRAYRLPLPGFVNVDPHNSLGTPLLDGENGVAAVADMIRNARRAGAHALLLRHVTIDGPMMTHVRMALAAHGLAPIVSDAHERALLDATRDADELLLDALGPKRLKEMRRLRKKLAEHGNVAFDVARTPDEIAAALPDFLDLEAKGWKGARGTALQQHDGNLSFIRRATAALASQGQCEVIALRAGDRAVAAGIVLRHLDRAFYFKIGVDPAFAKLSVGVQLTLELTRHLCADPSIVSADSTADPGHPMIDPIWRNRIAIGDVLVPLRRYDPVLPLIRFALYARRNARVMALRALGRKA